MQPIWPHGDRRANQAAAMCMMLSGADLLVRASRDEGVEYLFAFPNGAALHVYDTTFSQRKVGHIPVRHE